MRNVADISVTTKWYFVISKTITIKNLISALNIMVVPYAFLVHICNNKEHHNAYVSNE